MIQEEYVSFETAKLLKKKGFDEPCDHFYRFDNPKTIYTGTSYRNSEIGDKQSKVYNTCTQQMAMRWLREVHNLHIQLFIGNDSSNDADGNEVETWYFWSFSINGVPTGVVIYDDLAQFNCVEYQSYEDATEAAIKYCLEHLIK